MEESPEEFLDEISRGIAIRNPLRNFWEESLKSLEEFLNEILGGNLRTNSWFKFPEKFLEEITG